MSRNQKDALALLNRLQGKTLRPGQSAQNAIAGDYYTENYARRPAGRSDETISTEGMSEHSAWSPRSREAAQSAEPDVTTENRRARIEKVIKPRLHRKIAEQRDPRTAWRSPNVIDVRGDDYRVVEPDDGRTFGPVPELRRGERAVPDGTPDVRHRGRLYRLNRWENDRREDAGHKHRGFLRLHMSGSRNAPQ